MTIAILLSPVFSNYVFVSQISIGDALIFFTLPWLLVQHKSNLQMISNAVFSLSIISSSFWLLDFGDVYAGFYRAAFYYCLVLLVISSKNLYFPYFIKFYSVICLFSSVAIIFQHVAYHFFGMSIPLQLPFEYYEPDTLNVIDHVFRSGGVFKEPSYFAMYVMPYLILVSLRRNFPHFLLISFAGVLSTSSLMFFLVSISSVLLYWRMFNKYSTAAFIFVMLTVFVVLFLSGFIDEFIFLERVKLIFVDGGTLRDRFLPFMETFSSTAGFFPSVANLDFLRSSGLWLNSAASLVMYFGVSSIFLLLLNLYKFNLLFGLLFLMLIFTTHFMSGAFSYFIAIAFIVVKNPFHFRY